MLSERAARLLTNHPEGRLCGVTFTRDAADELKARILSSGQEQARRLDVGTFHSIALAQIRRSGQRPPRLLSDGERLALIRRCWEQYSPKVSYEEATQVIDAAKARLAPPIFSSPALESMYHAYQELLRSEGAMDFADLLLHAVRGMTSGDIPLLPIRWLLVDEAQDMDEVQMEWVLIHGRSGVEITLVGDDDQSLYAFRYALGHTGLQKVTRTLSATEITLPISYRCAPNILFHAERLIRHNQDRTPKKIMAHRNDPGKILVYQVPTRWDEMNMLTEAISDKQQWAILGRTNALLDIAEATLSEAGIPYVRTGGKSVWEHSVGSVFLGLLRSILDESWVGVANAMAFCGIRSELINEISLRFSGPCSARLERAIIEAEANEIDTLLNLQNGLGAWKEQAAKGRASLVAHGVSQFLIDYNNSTNQKNLLRKLEASVSKMSGSLAQRLAALSRHKQSQDRCCVHIMTLHASKGLEFDRVWIIGCEEGIIPHVDAEVEDERRLLYVGITRAKHWLTISYIEGTKSRFIEESELATAIKKVGGE